MADVQSKDVYVSPTMRFVDTEGRLTKQGFDIIKAAAQIIEAVTIEDGEVTADMISVDSLEAISATLGDVVVDGDLIVNGSLTTEKHQDDSITAGDSVITAGSIQVSTDTVVQSDFIVPDGGKLLVIAGVLIEPVSGSMTPVLQLRKGGSAVQSITLDFSSISVGVKQNITFTYLDNSPSAATWDILVSEPGPGAVACSMRTITNFNGKK